MRLRHLGVGLAVLALIASACGDDDGGEQQSLEEEPAESITPGQFEGETLDVWIMEGTNPDAEPFFNDVATEFEAQTGAALDVQFVEWANAQDKFTTGIAGGQLPDVAEVGTTWTPGFADAGALVDLTGRIEQAGLTDDVVPALLDTGELDDAVYGMPWYAGVRSIIYRSDVFEQAGIEPPTSWDEIVDVCNELKTAAPDMIPFPIAGNSEYGVDPFIWGAGGEIAVQEGGQWTATLDSAEAREGIAFYTGLATEHECSVPQASTWDETNLSEAFSAGDAAMMIAGSWTPKALIEANPDLEGKIGVTPIPGPEGGSYSPSFLGGSHLSIFNTTPENKLELAWHFIELMTTGEYAAKWAEQTSFFPPVEDQLEELTASGNPLVSPFAEQFMEAGATVPVTPAYEKIQGNATMTAMLNAILTGEASVEAATEKATQEMNDVFAGG
jgi:N,N'-diacetylchitobiose transport system substrate-binding protein